MLLLLPVPGTAQTAQRLTAVGIYRISNGTYTRSDSIAYYYSQGRGSHLEVRLPNDFGIPVDVLEWVATAKEHPYRDIRFDSSIEYANTGAFDKEENTYTAGNKLATTLSSSMVNGVWTPMRQTQYTYNLPGNTSQVLYKSWDFAALQWKNSGRRYTFYNGANLQDSGYTQLPLPNGTWLNQSAFAYGWTGNNLTHQQLYSWDSAANKWKQQYDHTIYYTGAVLDSAYIRTPVDLQSIRKYQYDANGHMIRYTKNWGPLFTDVTDSCIYDAAGDRVLTFEYYYPLFIYPYSNAINSRTAIAYTSFHQPREETIAWYDSSIQSYHDTIQYRFYYEAYTPAAGIATVQETPVIELFPNPAATVLYLHINHAPALTDVLTISDAAGKVVMTGSVRQGAQGINISQLRPGAYQLSVSGGGSIWSRPFTVLR